MMELPDFISDYSALFGTIRKVVPPSMNIYLVGGAVRDILLKRRIRDFDFTVDGLVRPIGKHIANELGGAYYVLDDERDMVRVIIDDEEKGQYDVDISLLAGETIEDDLRDRDFTLNAIAIKLADQPLLIDPLGGLSDVQRGILHMCAPDSLDNDPLRSLRAIRMSLDFGLELDDELQKAMIKASEQLRKSSLERYRDELFKIIRLNKNNVAVEKFAKFDLLQYLFPNSKDLLNNNDRKWIKNTDFFSVLLTKHDQDISTEDEYADYASRRLGNFRGALLAFFDKTLSLYHSRRMLMSFSTISFVLSYENPETVNRWCNRLAFSSSEAKFVDQTLQSYAYLNKLHSSTQCSDVDIYRYFKQYKEGGVAGLLIFLSNKYSETDKPTSYKQWCEWVVFVQNYISAYFTRYYDLIAPKLYLSGNDIQKLLNITAGPIIGQIKDSLIEAQIRGAVKNTSEAESFVRHFYNNPNENNSLE